MIQKLPLRRRVTLAFLLLGFALSALFAAAAVFITEDYEHVIASEMLQGQAEDYALRFANHLPVTLPQTQRMSGYRADDPNLPKAAVNLKPGVYEDEGSDGVHIGVFDTSVGRLVFVIDLRDIERLEEHLNFFLAALGILGTALAGWLGWLLSGAALKPVRVLATQVDALPNEPRASNLSDENSDDEVGQLAKAIDNYQARLVEADAREQAFFADASHELRTPLTVIQGVADVMRDDLASSPAAQARLGRLERGVRDMRHLLEAMLSASRRAPLQPERIPAEALLRRVGQEVLTGKPDIQLVINASADFSAPRKEAELLICGLAQKLAQAHSTGKLQLEATAQHLLLQFLPELSRESHSGEIQTRADTGTGSALLDRLATRLGWRIEFDGEHRISIALQA